MGRFQQLARKAYHKFWVVDLMSYAVSTRALEEVLEPVRKDGTWSRAIPDYSAYKGVGYYRNIEPVQDHWELQSLAEAVLRNGAGRILEVGTLHGGTLLIWCIVAARDATIISVDLPLGSRLGAYESARKKLYRKFARDEQRVFLLRGDSHDPETLARVEEALNGEKLDFVFLDGDHTYEGVKKDFETYAPLCRPGGIFAFHDIREHPVRAYCDVHRFWEELRQEARHRSEEILSPTAAMGGIGVVYV